MGNKHQNDLLPFEGGGQYPVNYWVQIESAQYEVYFKYGELEILKGGLDTDLLVEGELCIQKNLGKPYSSWWNARETNAYLALISEMIRSGIFDPARIPSLKDIRNSPQYCLGQLPIYPVGLKCGVHSPSPPHSGTLNRHERKKRRLAGIHDHDAKCYIGVPAIDVTSWIAEHPDEHQGFKIVFPRIWASVAAALEG